MEKWRKMMKNYFSEKYNRLLFYDIAVHDDIGWFCNRLYSVLFRINLLTGKIDVETILPTESNNDIEQYGPIAYYDEKLIIAPRNGKSILIYDLNYKHIKRVEFDITGFDDENRYNLFTNIHITSENIAYIVPGRYYAIIKLDLNTFQITYLNSWYKNILNMTINADRVFSAYSVLENPNTLKVADWQNSQIIEIDLENDKTRVFKMLTEGGISSFSKHEELEIAAYIKIPKIVNINTLEEIELNVQGMKYDLGIRAIFVCNDDIYIFPINGNMIVSVSLKNRIQRNFLTLPIKPVEEMKEAAFINNNFLCIKRIKDNLIIASSLYESKIYIFDLEKQTYKIFSNQLDEKSRLLIQDKIAEYYFNIYEVEKEKEELCDWLKAIKNNKVKKSKNNEIRNIGKIIYNE